MRGKGDVVVGLQFGDEGKGRVVDLLAGGYDVVARYQGGANAGHTVVAMGRKFVFHLLPSGMLYPGKLCVVGNGVVLDPEQFFRELEELGPERAEVLVSGCAHVVMPYHKVLDALEEEAKERRIGTTRRGIGPAYADKHGRSGIRVYDLCDERGFAEKLRPILELKNRVIERVYGGRPLSFEEVYEPYADYGRRLKPFVGDASSAILEALRGGRRVLFEGAQGVMLDVDVGTYPYVTSSSTTSAGACVGTGVPPTAVGRVIGVVKAYATRVGEGPFPTELEGDLGEHLRRVGHEYGATTGRPRRCGWLDLVALKYAVEVSGAEALAITKLDVLKGLEEIRVCVAYVDAGGTRRERFVPETGFLSQVKPVYRSFKGWDEDLSGCRKLEDLPSAAREYVEFLASQLGAEVLMVGVGASREETILCSSWR